MVSGAAVVVLILLTLAVFVWVGVRASRRDTDVEDYVVARNSQSTSTLGLSFLAAGMGAWILFAPPEVGAGVGMVGVAGYAVGAAVPFLVYGLLGPRIRSVLPPATAFRSSCACGSAARSPSMWLASRCCTCCSS